MASARRAPPTAPLPRAGRRAQDPDVKAFSIAILSIVLGLAAVAASEQPQPVKKVAITIDDIGLSRSYADATVQAAMAASLKKVSAYERESPMSSIVIA